ncbi:MAG: signal peptidase I [Oscillospiraceae bacterium]|nr:signal peptidase I [Oscillospiraceae bacterium]
MENYENNPVTESENQKPKRRAARKGSTLLLYLHDIIYLLAAIMVLLLVFFRIVVVSGSSMKNTLVDGDYLLLLSNVFYREPKQGDIVVISKDSFDNGAPIVKRVIATEGQFVRFLEGKVYVGDSPDLENMQLLEEPYVSSPMLDTDGVVKVQEGYIFVMGDNRSGSKDSRDPVIGQIDKREVLGKVIFLMLPGTDKGHEAPDYSRIGAVS